MCASCVHHCGTYVQDERALLRTASAELEEQGKVSAKEQAEAHEASAAFEKEETEAVEAEQALKDAQTALASAQKLLKQAKADGDDDMVDSHQSGEFMYSCSILYDAASFLQLTCGMSCGYADVSAAETLVAEKLESAQKERAEAVEAKAIKTKETKKAKEAEKARCVRRRPIHFSAQSLLFANLLFVFSVVCWCPSMV